MYEGGKSIACFTRRNIIEENVKVKEEWKIYWGERIGGVGDSMFAGGLAGMVGANIGR